MQPGFIAAVAVGVTILVVARAWATRRAAAGDTRYTWILFIPILIGAVVMVWAAVTLTSTSLAAAAVLAVVGAITLGLVVRLMRDRTTLRQAEIGEGPYVDYLIWMAIGAPMLLVALLLVLAISGGPDGRDP